MYDKNLAILRQSFANSVFTHKIHEVACERNEKNILCIKISNIALISFILITLVLQLIYNNIIFSYIGISLTIIEIIFLIIQLTFNFEQNAISHKNSALKYMSLRDCYKNLIVDVMEKSIKENKIIQKRNLLQKEYQIISELSPQTNSNDYKITQQRLNKKGIVEGEDFSWSDDEINHFLPEKLRI